MVLCKIARIQRSSYYKWLNRTPSNNEKFNEEIIEEIKRVTGLKLKVFLWVQPFLFAYQDYIKLP